MNGEPGAMAGVVSCPGRAVADFEWPSAETSECPYPYFAALRANAPVYKYPGRNEFLVSRWDDIVAVSRQPEIFSNTITTEDDPQFYKSIRADAELERGGGKFTPWSMANSDPPEHKLKRGIGLRVIAHQKMDPVMIRRTADALIDKWIQRGECEFRSQFSDWLPVQVITNILGLPSEKLQMFKDWGESEGAGVRYATEEEIAREEVKTRQATECLQAELLERFERPREDALTDLITDQIHQEGEFDLDYLVKETFVLVFAGNVTTAHMMATAMEHLCKQPALMARVRDDYELIPRVLEEALRMEAPVQWRQRWAKQDTEIGGVPIPKGSGIIMLYGSGNRDDRRWGRESDAFDIDRPNVVKHNLAFGHGIHRCLGAPLARLEGRIAFEALFDRLQDICMDEEQSDLTHIASRHFRAPKRVHIRFDAP